MSFAYTGNSTNVTVSNLNVLTLPQDGTDQASATTVVNPFKICVDELAKLGELMAYRRPLLGVHCVNGAAGNIILSALPPLFVYSGSKWIYTSKSTTTTMTVADKEGGGNFTSGFNYYAYVKSTDGTPIFVISTDAPDTACIFKNSGATNPTQFRFLYSFVAAGATTVVPFRMINGDYTFDPALLIAYSVVDFAPALNTPTSIVPSVPVSASKVKFKAKLYNDSLVGSLDFAVTSSLSTDFTATFNIVTRGTPLYVWIEVPVFAGSAPLGKITDGGGGAINTDSKIRLVTAGYTE